jgi:hypothetical protein
MEGIACFPTGNEKQKKQKEIHQESPTLLTTILEAYGI